MSFILLVYVAFLMVVLFMRYRIITSVIAMVLFLVAMTTAAFVYGMAYFQSSDVLVLLNSNLPKREFLHLIAGWYVLDAVCIVRIIRNYREYREVNRNQG